MARIELQPDFREFLRLLNCHEVEYLLVGGYAVGYYGYPRATGDMDVWIAISETNAEKTARAVREFGMPEQGTVKDLFTQENKVIRMGVPPVRIEVITGASGVRFADCYSRRDVVDMDGVSVNLISLADLKANKQACGRYKELEDLKHLPQ
jgi:predicted nucleotidyltransferase